MNFLKAIFSFNSNEKKAQKRKAILEKLSPAKVASQQAFAQALQSDPELNIRLYACRRLNDVTLLQPYLADEHPMELRQAASRRIHQLLLGLVEGGPDCLQRIALLEQVEDEQFLEKLAAEGQGADLRIAALKRIKRQALLGDIAINDKDAEVRWVAVQAIEKPGTLKRVAKGAKNRDKRVSAWAREQLAKLEVHKAKPGELKDVRGKIYDGLSVVLHQCRSTDDWLSSAALISDLEQRWKDCKHQWQTQKLGHWDEMLERRFQLAITTFHKNEQEQHQQKEKEALLAAQLFSHKSAMEAVCASLSQQLEVLKVSSPCREAVDNSQALINSAEQSWQQIDQQAIQQLSKLNAEHGRLIDALNEHCKAMLSHLSGAEQLAALVNTLDALESGDRSPAPQTLKQIDKQLSALPDNSLYPLDETQLAHVRAQIKTLQENLDAKQKQRQKNIDAFTTFISDIESSHKEGESKKALQQVRRAQKLQAEFNEHEQNVLRKNGALKRFQAIRKQVEELQDWKRWSGAPIKERLVNDAEQLAQAAEANVNNEYYDFNDTAQRIRSAREEWKTTNVGEKGESPELWQRFDEACSRAYSYCQNYFDQQHKVKDQALAERASICDGLKTYADQIPAQIEAGTIDWKALERVIRTAENEWREMAEVHLKDRQAINKRFRSAMNSLHQFADERRKNNQDEKQKLIDRAQSIVKDLQEAQLEMSDAIEKSKQLQVSWKKIGPAKGDNALWKTFRQHCDEVFKQKAVVAQAHKATLNSNLEEKQSLNLRILALAKLEGKALKQARAEFEAIKQTWQQVGPVPTKSGGTVNKAFEEACKKFEQQGRLGVIQQERQKWDGLNRRAEISTELEYALEQGTAELQAFQSQWQAMAEERCTGQVEIEQRYNAALALLLNADAKSVIQQRLQQGLEDRLQLCLQLEIFAGIDSPAEYAQSRMAYQVTMLADKMKQGDSEHRREQLLSLQKQWFTTHSAPQSRSAELDARYQRCMQQLSEEVEEALLDSLAG